MRKLILIAMGLVIVILGSSCAMPGKDKAVATEQGYDYKIHYGYLPASGEYYVYEEDYEIVDGIMYLDRFHRVAYGSATSHEVVVITSAWTLWEYKE